MNKHQINDLAQPQHHKHTRLHQPNQIKQYETLCLNQSQLKHQYAIRPFPSNDRKSSRRDHKISQSPYQLSLSKSKKIDLSTKKQEQALGHKGGKQFNEMLSELLKLKSQYKILKNNYGALVLESSKGLECWQGQKKALMNEVEKTKRQMQNYKKQNNILGQQIDRIKKECYKVLQMERFKLKKIEQILQQKQLMIAFLRKQLQGPNQQQPAHHSIFFRPSNHHLQYDYLNLNPNNTIINPQKHLSSHQNNQIEEDSLSLSRDKSKQIDSIFHSFLSNAQHSRLSQAAFTKKVTNNMFVSLSQSPIEHEDNEIQKSQKQDQDVAEMRIKQYSQPLKKNKPQLSEFLQKDKETIAVSKAKTKHKQLQIITNQNINCSNEPTSREDFSLQTQKRAANCSLNLNSKQQKKKTTRKNKG